MQPILRQLYSGELCPGQQMPKSDEYMDSHNALLKSSEDLKARFPELESKIKDLLNEYSLMNTIEREEMFEYGFSLGIRLVLDALSISNT